MITKNVLKTADKNNLQKAEKKKDQKRKIDD